MAKNTSILLGDYFDNFINNQVKSGRFSSASEVVRAALRMFEQEETKKTELIRKRSVLDSFCRQRKPLHPKLAVLSSGYHLAVI